MRLFISLLILLSGCSVKPVDNIQTVHGLKIILSGQDQNTYHLVDQQGVRLSSSIVQDSVINFSISNDANLEQCFTVYDSKGRDIFKGNMFSLPLINEYKKAEKLKTILEKKSEKMMKKWNIFNPTLKKQG